MRREELRVEARLQAGWNREDGKRLDSERLGSHSFQKYAGNQRDSWIEMVLVEKLVVNREEDLSWKPQLFPTISLTMFYLTSLLLLLLMSPLYLISECHSTSIS